MKLAGIVLALFVLGQTPTIQYFRTGSTILKEAGQWEKYSRGEKPDSLDSISYFQGYVSGVLDAEGQSIKTPERFTVDQACAIVARFLSQAKTT